MNQNLKDRIKKQSDFLERRKKDIVIDADTHLTDIKGMVSGQKEFMDNNPDYYHGKAIGAEDLLKEMYQAGVDMALIWQNPAATPYRNDPEFNFQSLLKANKYILDCAEKYPEKFIPAGWTDPKNLGLEKALDLTDILVKESGFGIVKVNPAQNQFPIDSEPVFKVIERIISLGAMPAFHYGADTIYTPPEGLAKLAERFKESPLLAIHMGGGGASYTDADEQYILSRELGLKYPNIKYVMSAKRDTHIESDLIRYQLAGDPFRKNLFCASDAPYGKPSWNFGGFRTMFKALSDGKNHPDRRLQAKPGLFDDSSVKGYLGGNFAKLMIDVYRHLLEQY